MAIAKKKNDLHQKRLGQILFEKKFLTRENLQNALAIQKQNGEPLGQILLEKGFITEDNLLEALSIQLNIPSAKIDSYDIDPAVVEIVPKKIATKYRIIPLFRVENTLTVATADPLDVYVLDFLRHRTGYQIQTVLAKVSDIDRAIEKYYRVGDSLKEVIQDIEVDDSPQVEMGSAYQDNSKEGSSVVKVVNLILAQAIRDRASDIHIEPDEKVLRVRYRIDGLLHEAFKLPKKFHAMVASRIKIMANLDVSEKRLPQDGRFEYKSDGKTVDLRISILPTVKGEKVVMRILDKAGFILDIAKMGFSPKVAEKWNELIHRSQGLLLITGPTGSGKTSTLYASLNEINTPDKNIITVENPVEYNFPLINQVQVNEKARLTFAAGLRSILRQDPDVVMIGEIRDQESAEIAIRAALTGHLVLSTLHTNDAPSAVTRLIDMGIEPFLVASSLLGIMGQRLVRRICAVCKQEIALSPEEQQSLRLPEKFGKTRFFKGKGCRECHGTGYQGRVGIHELLVVDPEIRRAVVKESSDEVIRDMAIRHGMDTMRVDGLRKAALGLTTVEEVLRVT